MPIFCIHLYIYGGFGNALEQDNSQEYFYCHSLITVKWDCPEGFRKGPRSCYAFYLKSGNMVPREAARSACQALDLRARLVSIETKTEMQYLIATAQEITGRRKFLLRCVCTW